jgi:hypothetical protein
MDTNCATIYAASMAKKTVTKPKKKLARDQSQIALSVVEKAIGGKLAQRNASASRRKGR